MNNSLLTDFYELTMANGYYEAGMQDCVASFDLFYRRVPDGGGFVICAGLEQVIEYLQHLSFSGDDVSYLKSLGLFSDSFLEYLRKFRFSCDVWAAPEGTVAFPGEPLLVVRGPVIEAQIVETMLLLLINHQSLIATKANRIVRAARGRQVMEFGSRRAHGTEGALLGARAAYIGGCSATACTLAGKMFGIPVSGTMAHSWVQLFDNELEAFRAYARTCPNDCIFLVDTYNVIKSGVPNAIAAAQSEIIPRGGRLKGIRIDSGDLGELSRMARMLLDEAGFSDCKIVASDALDERRICRLVRDGAPVDSFGVGERLITARSEPVLGGVYKLSAIERDGHMVPKMKISETAEKSTVPGCKQLWRLYDQAGIAVADVIASIAERITEIAGYEAVDLYNGARCRFDGLSARNMLVPVFSKGECVYSSPVLADIRQYCRRETESLTAELKSFAQPERYKVCVTTKIGEMLKNCRCGR